jgi:hypothetical protein
MSANRDRSILAFGPTFASRARRTGVQLVVSDAHVGLKKAIAQVSLAALHGSLPT